MKTIFALAVFCTVLFFGGSKVEGIFQSSYYNIRSEHRLAGHVIKTTITHSELACAHKCLALDGCKSSNFRTNENKHDNCELNSRGLLSQIFDPDLIHDEGFVFISHENVSYTILWGPILSYYTLLRYSRVTAQKMKNSAIMCSSLYMEKVTVHPCVGFTMENIDTLEEDCKQIVY